MKYILDVQFDPDTGDYYIQLPDNVIADLGWELGDTVVWEDKGNNSFSLRKKDATSKVD